MPAGVKTVSCLAGASLSFQKVCSTPRGMKTNEPSARRGSAQSLERFDSEDRDLAAVARVEVEHTVFLEGI
jgi:hypothetical protein